MSSESLELYVGKDCSNSELCRVGEMIKPMAAVANPTVTVVDISEGEESVKSYKRFEVPLKPGTDTKQLLAELNENKNVQRVAVVRPREENGEDVDVAVCVIL